MAVELDLGPAARAFRDELRQWLEAHAHRAEGTAQGRGAQSGRWADALAEAGYLCVAWPKEYGGRGLTGVEVAVLNEEFARAGVPRVTRGMGEGLVGPAIILHGTDAQKEYFLPRIISGEDRYCQGFSEPDAGSDLAALTTRGVVDGGEIAITGQKVWTSWYWDATTLFCLCRTDPAAPKHRGISYVLVPLLREDGSANGIEFRPLKQLTGSSHFAETFLDDARAPLDNVIGGLHNGWRTAMTTLGNERGGTATTQHLAFAEELAALTAETVARGRAEDPLVRQQLAWAECHVGIMRASGARLLAAVADRRDPGPGASVNKVFWSEYQRRLGEVAMGILGAEGMLTGGSEPGDGGTDPAPDDTGLGRWQSTFLTTRSHTIWGGTAEIQRNIVGERVLGLPKEPRTES